MSEKPKEPESLGGRKYLYKGAADWESEIFPAYHADLIAWQEDRIAELEKALREVNDLCVNASHNHMDIDPEVHRIVKAALGL